MHDSENQAGLNPHHTKIRGIRVRFCLFLAELFLTGPLKPYGFRNVKNVRFESTEHYVADRVDQLREYQALFGQFCSFENKTVLELGCSTGYLLNEFLKFEKFNAIGADIDPSVIDSARASFGERIQFIESTSLSIPLPDASVDIVYTIDTVEHLSKPREIFMDVHRILRSKGLFLIHFHPWLGPYGAHLEDIIPFPWPQALFSMDTLLTVAADLYDSPDYSTACYHIDPKTGNKKPNPYLDKTSWDSFLNHITIRQFRKTIKDLPFETIHFKRIGFGGKMFPLARCMRGWALLPGPDEFLTKAIFCVLRKA